MKKHNQNNVEMYMAKETPTNMAGRQITGPTLLVWAASPDSYEVSINAQ